MSQYKIVKCVVSLLIILILSSCSKAVKEEERGKVLYETYCTSCHIPVSISDLPKKAWEDGVIPEVGARLGVLYDGYNPYDGLSFPEIELIYKAGIFPLKPVIEREDWQILKKYILDKAPDSIMSQGNNYTSNELTSFTANTISLDENPGSLITFLDLDEKRNRILTGDISGNLYSYKLNEGNSLIGSFGSGVTAYTENDSISYTTAVGVLTPSELSSGKIIMTRDNEQFDVSGVLHRPVNNLVHDLDKDGIDELVISEFGHHTGKLTLLHNFKNGVFEKKVLLNQPGAIRVLAKDMDNDGKDDLIALMAQGDESITILYQKDNFRFDAEKVIRFSPIYGLSWFELIDFNNDGFQDIVTVNGDNADKTYVHKPYHGLRIHINDGKNNFEEKYFFSINGSTRLVAEDFDMDGDFDFGIISTFPDYKNHPKRSFVYLENKNYKTYEFEPKTIEDSKLGRWLLMDSGDVDQDGDKDIILSSFTYSFTPVPDENKELWNNKNADILILENKLK
ncbi:FG-GAP repeat domain-containing protein [Urechidicola croceus]|uniref:Cytochrome c domain-containing protein n=1 Tax=Urechidicola croceus TaxID=1850246 RepID=A0A1D8P5H3_9FLAO|nr:VCBS repeat-containing protein [Urechidicola croceus]AOW19820.1 hypothetical protein LPB138_03585 [Urechidicola croceus]